MRPGAAKTSEVSKASEVLLLGLGKGAVTSQTRKTIVLCLLSGIACGVLTASQCASLENNCRVAAVSPDHSWSIWLHWVNWAPGLLFGILFSVVNVPQGRTDRAQRIALYSAASGLIYLIAGLIFSPAAAAASENYNLAVLFIAGAVTGLIGALLLAISGHVLTRPPVDFKAGDVRPLAAAIVGALAGLLFTAVGFYGGDGNLIFWPLAFAIWQVAVGISISLSLQRKARRA